jgi:hypothetical protein
MLQNLMRLKRTCSLAIFVSSAQHQCFHQLWLPDVTNVEPNAISPDTRKILEGWGQKFGDPQPANQVAVILVGAPWLGGKALGY